MPFHDLPLILILQHLDGNIRLGQPLFFPELLALHERENRLIEILTNLARILLNQTPPIAIHRRIPGRTPDLSRLSLTIKPTKKSVAWSEPITLEFDVLRWRHGDDTFLAHIPTLGIEVIASREDQLEELIPRHARAALARSGAADSLFNLAQLARVQSISLQSETITADIPTPAQLADESAKKKDASKPVIEEAGQVLTDSNTPRAWHVNDQVERLADALTSAVPQSILLVGPSGVGKTALFGELFHQRRHHRLSHVPFWATSGARLIAGMSGYGLWQERCQKLARQAKQAGAILHLGNLIELMEVGKAGGSQFGIASFFRPFLARRDILAIAECTAEQLPLIEKSNPHLLAAFQQIEITEPSPPTVTDILSTEADQFCQDHSTPHYPISIEPAAIDTVVRLHRRYTTYSAPPGRPLRFLKNLLQDRAATLNPDPQPLNPQDITAAFSRETGLPHFLLDDATPLDLPAARAHFASRVIGQSHAVDLVTDLLATVKAALNRPRRPIASLLFIGPTGVGKTEMAKTLADYFFGAGHTPQSPASASPRLLRFDMSEFATPAAVTRLVGTAWETEGLLTSKIREQPFCVLLLDEFEKAYPSFFDLLLQVLGEGRLTDSAGRLADFSNTIVVLTSNLGASSFGAGPFGLSQAAADSSAHAQDHFTQAVQNFLRPELFNRIDRIIPFLPLGADSIHQIARREIDLISYRDGIRQRDLRLDISPAAIDHLASAGYDPLYGVRPLKRRIEQDLLAPLADSANQYSPETPLLARVDLASGHLAINVRGRTRDDESHVAKPDVFFSSIFLSAILNFRRRLQAIARCPAALSLTNELFTLHRSITRKQATGKRFIDPQDRERLKRLQSIQDAQHRLITHVTSLEDALLLNLYESVPLPAEIMPLEEQSAQVNLQSQRLLLDLFTLSQPDPHAITLALYASAPADLFLLAQAYRQAAALSPFESESQESADSHHFPFPAALSVSYYTRYSKTTLNRTTLVPNEIDPFLANPRPGVLGIALAIRAPFARARFETEAGLHVVEEEKGKNQRPILIDTWPLDPADYRPPKDVEFRIALAGQRRRTYTLDRHELEDTATTKTYRWSTRNLATALSAALNDHLSQRAQSMLE